MQPKPIAQVPLLSPSFRRMFFPNATVRLFLFPLPSPVSLLRRLPLLFRNQRLDSPVVCSRVNQPFAVPHRCPSPLFPSGSKPPRRPWRSRRFCFLQVKGPLFPKNNSPPRHQRSSSKVIPFLLHHPTWFSRPWRLARFGLFFFVSLSPCTGHPPSFFPLTQRGPFSVQTEVLLLSVGMHRGIEVPRTDPFRDREFSDRFDEKRFPRRSSPSPHGMEDENDEEPQCLISTQNSSFPYGFPLRPL